MLKLNFLACLLSNFYSNAREKPLTQHAASFDLQAVLLCPDLPVKDLYFKRKLNFYYFTIYDEGSRQSHSFTWDECEAKRGSVEIASCLYLYLERLAETVEHVTLISDGCGGQNKNLFVMTSLLVAVQLLDIKRIDHIFLTSGHTQMDVDAIHSLVESEAKKEKGIGGIRGPSDWNRVIKNAAKIRPLEVHAIKNREIIAWKKIAEKIVTNSKVFSNGEPIAFNKTRWMRFEKSKAGEVAVHYRIDPTEPAKIWFVTERIETGMRRASARVRFGFPTPKELRELMTLRQYEGRIPIDKAKKKDLLEACQKNFVPQFWRKFYASLPTETGAKSESDEESGHYSSSPFESSSESESEESSSSAESSSASTDRAEVSTESSN